MVKGTFSNDVHFAIGVSDTSTDRSFAGASQNGVTSSGSNRRLASKALTIIEVDGTVLAEADVTAVSSTTFTLNWTTNNGTAYVIHFIAIGGTDVSAKVVGFTNPATIGNKSVTGVGFKPNVVVLLHAGAITGSPPTTISSMGIGIGVMDADGDQWALETISFDGSNPTDTQRGQRTDRALGVVTPTPAFDVEAAWVSMDSDGFTVNYSSVVSGYQVVALALKGANVKAGSFAKSTSTSTTPTSRHRATPRTSTRRRRCS